MRTMYQDIDQPVQVGVKFGSNQIQPVWFVWKGRRYKVDEVNLYHRSFKGEAPIHHFSVSAGGEVYQLSFDGKKLKWNLDQMWVE